MQQGIYLGFSNQATHQKNSWYYYASRVVFARSGRRSYCTYGRENGCFASPRRCYSRWLFSELDDPANQHRRYCPSHSNSPLAFRKLLIPFKAVRTGDATARNASHGPAEEIPICDKRSGKHVFLGHCGYSRKYPSSGGGAFLGREQPLHPRVEAAGGFSRGPECTSGLPC